MSGGAPDNLRSFLHCSRVLQLGLDPAGYAGRPIVGIFNTWPGINPCRALFKERVEDIKHAIYHPRRDAILACIAAEMTKLSEAGEKGPAYDTNGLGC